MSYPLFEIRHDRFSAGWVDRHFNPPWLPVRKMWTTFGRIARKRILFVANELQTDAPAGEFTIQETP
jgi:hypothetical protein